MSHGNHWSAFVPDIESFFSTKFREAVAKGRIVGDIDSNKDDPFYVAIEHPTGAPARILAVLKRIPVENRSEVVSGYPYLAEGAAVPFEILGINPSDDEYSAEFEGTLDLLMQDGFTLTVCDPLFYLNRSRYSVAQKYEFSLAALAYVFEQVENTDLVITEGPMIQMEHERVLAENPQADVSAITSVTVSMAELRTVIPTEDGDAEYQTVIEETGCCEVEGVTVHWMRVYLRPKDDADLPCILYASEHVLKGYVPKVGDCVRGVAWFQASPLKPMEPSPSWADALPEISREADIQGFQRAMGAEKYLAGLPLGIVELAKGIIATGWEVTRYENVDGVNDLPVLVMERRDEQINLWARAWIEGQEAVQDFSPEEKQRFTEESVGRNQKAAFVTVKVLDAGDGYRFFYDGTAELETIIGPLRLIEYVRKSETSDPTF